MKNKGLAGHVVPPRLGEGEIDQFTILAALALVAVYVPGNFWDARYRPCSSGEIDDDQQNYSECAGNLVCIYNLDESRWTSAKT